MPNTLDELLDFHNLTKEEYDDIVSRLGREHNLTELGLFSVIWSGGYPESS